MPENLAMKRKLESGEAIDVSSMRVDGGPTYELKEYVDGKDYCDFERGEWIWSIGRSKTSGRIFAATDSRFYGNHNFECLWLR